MTDNNPLARTTWRKSSFSGSGGTGGGNCVELAALPGGIAIRNSNDPHGPTILFTRDELNAWIRGCKAGEFDDLT
jgi:hypothetical protein